MKENIFRTVFHGLTWIPTTYVFQKVIPYFLSVASKRSHDIEFGTFLPMGFFLSFILAGIQYEFDILKEKRRTSIERHCVFTLCAYSYSCSRVMTVSTAYRLWPKWDRVVREYHSPSLTYSVDIGSARTRPMTIATQHERPSSPHAGLPLLAHHPSDPLPTRWPGGYLPWAITSHGGGLGGGRKNRHDDRAFWMLSFLYHSSTKPS